jgi:hypothetical protein
MNTPTKWTALEPWFVIALALLLRLPALGWDYFVDDHGLQLVVEGAVEHPTLRPWSAFDFGAASGIHSAPDTTSALPWWTSPEWKVRFFRPLASLTHWFDAACWGRNPLAAHVTSLALFAMVLVALRSLYLAAGLSERVLPWALAVFAFDDGSLFPVAWIANRSTLLEALCTTLAVAFALRARAAPSPLGFAAALVFSLGACLSKESGVAAPLLVAVVLGRSGRAPSRPKAAVALALAVVYLAALLAAGYGARSDFYLTPWGEPVQFAQRALQLAVLGSLSVFGPFPVDAPMFFDELLVPWTAVALVVGVWLSSIAWRSASTWPERGLFALWFVLTLLPQGGAFPSDRLLFVPLIGAAPLIGAVCARALDPLAWRQRWLPACVALSAVGLCALVVFARGRDFASKIELVNAAAVSFDVPADGREHDALVFQSGSLMNSLAPDPVWRMRTGREDVRLHPLQAGRRALRITAVDESTLDVSFEGAALLDRPFERVFRVGGAPLQVGERFAHRAFEVEVLETPSARARTVLRLRFPEPTASPRWCWLTWRDGAFRSIALPRIGEALDLPEAALLDPLLP